MAGGHLHQHREDELLLGQKPGASWGLKRRYDVRYNRSSWLACGACYLVKVQQRFLHEPCCQLPETFCSPIAAPVVLLECGDFEGEVQGMASDGRCFMCVCVCVCTCECECEVQCGATSCGRHGGRLCGSRTSDVVCSCELQSIASRVSRSHILFLCQHLLSW